MAMHKPSCLIVGTGEYVTGYVHGAGSQASESTTLNLFNIVQCNN